MFDRVSIARLGCIWLFLVLTARPAVGQASVSSDELVIPADALEQVDKIFERWETTESPGCAVGVGLGGTTVLARAYGMADLEQERPNSTDTVFEVGSVSKQFTAAAVLLLAQQGKLSLDDPVRKYIPELPDYGQPLTIRHVLTHTSGLRDWGSVVAVAGWPRTTRVHTHAHVLDVVSRQKALNFPPGDQYSYSNTGYNLSAILVSRVSGEPFAQFCEKRIFEPLGMADTRWRDDFKRIVKRRATAYAPEDENGWQLDMPFENVHGNGGLLTTIADMLKWNESYGHARVGGPQFLEEQLRHGRLNDGTEISYCAGLRVESWRGVREVSHSGSTAGYRAFLARYPDYELSVALACNAANVDPTRLGHDVAEVFLGARLVPVTEPEAISLAPEVLERHAGTYRDVRTGAALELVVDEDKLRIQGGPELIPISDASYRVEESDSRVEMVVNAEGNVAEARRVAPNGDTEKYVREVAAAPDERTLSSYAGRYRSEEAELELVAGVENGRLVLRRRPDDVFELKAAWADAFISPFGTVVFHRGEGGRVHAMSLRVPRMYDLRLARVADRDRGAHP